MWVQWQAEEAATLQNLDEVTAQILLLTSPETCHSTKLFCAVRITESLRNIPAAYLDFLYNNQDI